MFIVEPRYEDPAGEPTLPFGIILHPKTASQSIREALRQTFDARSPGGHHGYKEEDCERLRNAGGIVCSVVRNPWDVMVSWWAYNQLKAYNGQFPTVEPFADWLPRTLEAGNGWIEKGLFYGVDECNRIIRFEHSIENQLNNCLIDCGLPPVTLKHVGGSPREKDYREHYTTREALLVDRYCRNEIVEWGYEF